MKKDLLAQELKKASETVIQTNSDQTLGHQNYNLETVVPQYWDNLTPFLSILPRQGGQSGSAINWKFVKRLKTGRKHLGAPEGGRGALMSRDFIDKTAAFKTLMLETRVTDQVAAASRGLSPDALASATEGLIAEFTQLEHRAIINGCNSAIASPGAPVATLTAGGTLADGAYAVRVVALTGEGWFNWVEGGSSLVAGIALDQVVALADGSTVTIKGGASSASTASNTVTVAGANKSITATVADVAGAFAYAWFVGLAASPNAMTLAAVTHINRVVVTALGPGPQAAGDFAVNRTDNALVFDGLLRQISVADSGAVIRSLDGAGLTDAGAGRVAELDTAFKAAWDNDKIVYTHIFASSDVCTKLNQIVSKGTGPAQFQLAQTANGQLTSGIAVAAYLPPIPAADSRPAQIIACPDLPPGTVILFCDRIQYASGVGMPADIVLGIDYNMETWPRTRASTEMCMLTYGTPRVKYGAAFGLLKNVGV